MAEGIIVVGPGAVGGALAARWIESGKDIYVMARRAADEGVLARRGLSFIGTSGRPRLVRRGLYSARKQAPKPCSAVFLCVKSADIQLAIQEIKPWIGPKTVVVCLQNGLRHAAAVRKAFGAGRTVVGVCYFAAERRSRRCVAHNGGKDIHLARFAGNEDSFKRAAVLLKSAGWRITREDSEDAMLWTKLCFNAAGNPLGAVCRASNGELLQDVALKRLMESALDESIAVARKSGHRIDAARMRKMVLRAYPLGSRQRNSMLQDLEGRRRTEVDAIVGPILEAAKESLVPTPILSKLTYLVKRLERLP